ncbi:MAG: response regulator transcription factor [Eisenbergiella massiliensis]
MKLLIAEDDPDMQKILKLYLQREGCQVNIVDNGRAAIDFLSENQVDLVILDWMMPVQDGIKRQIRLLNFPVKVLMLTAKGEIENEITGLTCGADDYLRKPFDIGVPSAGEKAVPGGKYSEIPGASFEPGSDGSVETDGGLPLRKRLSFCIAFLATSKRCFPGMAFKSCMGDGFRRSRTVDTYPPPAEKSERIISGRA